MTVEHARKFVGGSDGDGASAMASPAAVAATLADTREDADDSAPLAPPRAIASATHKRKSLNNTEKCTPAKGKDVAKFFSMFPSPKSDSDDAPLHLMVKKAGASSASSAQKSTAPPSEAAEEVDDDGVGSTVSTVPCGDVEAAAAASEAAKMLSTQQGGSAPIALGWAEASDAVKALTAERDAYIRSLQDTSPGVVLTQEALHEHERNINERANQRLEESGAGDPYAGFTQKDAARIKELERWAREGGFPIKGAMANKFREVLAMSTDKLAAYKSCDREAAKKWRLEFLQEEILKVKGRRKQSTSWSKTDLQGCKYRTAARIFEDLGGRTDPEVAAGVVMGINKCIALGPPFFHKHPQTGLIEFVIIEFGWIEKFEKAWSEFVEEQVDNVEGSDAKKADAKAAAVDTIATRTTEDKKANATQKGTKPGPTPRNQTPGKPKPAALLPETIALNKLCVEANKVKTQYLATMTTAVELVAAIEHEPEYKLQKGGTEAELKRLVSCAKQGFTPFHKQFLISDMKSMRKSLGAETVKTELEKFVSLQDNFQNLSDFISGYSVAAKK